MHRLLKIRAVLLSATLLCALWPKEGRSQVVFNEAISRPVTVAVRHPSTPAYDDAISRPITVAVRNSNAVVFDEAISRPVTVVVRNSNAVEYDEAISKPVTVVVRNPNTVVFEEAISKPITVSVRNPNTVVYSEAISKPWTVRVADCNGNFVLDADDVSTGTSPDDNANGLPDECDVCGDLDADLIVDGDDFALFLLAFSHSTGDPEYHPGADFDADNIVTLLDYQQWRQCYRDFVGDPGASMPIPGNAGDANMDGVVDGRDLQLFVDKVLDPASASFTEFFVTDMNGDGQIDAADIDPFIEKMVPVERR